MDNLDDINEKFVLILEASCRLDHLLNTLRYHKELYESGDDSDFDHESTCDALIIAMLDGLNVVIDRVDEARDLLRRL